MESKICSALNLAFDPVAVLWSDEKPPDALQFKTGKWGCVMSLFAQAAKGRTAVFDRETFGCWGGGVGLGFGNQYLNVPGGIEGFYHFLSSGKSRDGSENKLAEKISHVMGNHFLDQLMNGERYLKSPDNVRAFVESLPIMEVPAKYVCFKPLSEVDDRMQKPVVIAFLANPNQISALVVLANYGRNSFESVSTPFAAACQTIGILPYREARADNPRAVMGLTDISARNNVRKQLGGDLFTFAVPFTMFREMEDNVEGSFLGRDTWKSLCE
jgi:uncharacterized protein (DUF169 family)